MYFYVGLQRKCSILLTSICGKKTNIDKQTNSNKSVFIISLLMHKLLSSYVKSLINSIKV